MKIVINRKYVKNVMYSTDSIYELKKNFVWNVLILAPKRCFLIMKVNLVTKKNGINTSSGQI